MARRFRPSDQLLPFGPSPALGSRPRRRKYAQLQRRLRLGRIRGYNSLRGYFPSFDHRAAALASQFLRHGEARGMYQASLRSLRRFYWWSRGRRTLRWLIPLRQSHQKTEFLVKALGALFAEERRTAGHRNFLGRRADALRRRAAEGAAASAGGPRATAKKRRPGRLPLGDPLGAPAPTSAAGLRRRWHGADALLGLRPLRSLERSDAAIPGAPATLRRQPCTAGYLGYLRARAQLWRRRALARRRRQLLRERRLRPRRLTAGAMAPSPVAETPAPTLPSPRRRRWLRALPSPARRQLRRRRRWALLSRGMSFLHRRRRALARRPREKSRRLARRRQRWLRRWGRRRPLRPWRRSLARSLGRLRRRSAAGVSPGEGVSTTPSPARQHRWARPARPALALPLLRSPARGALGLWKRRRPWLSATAPREPLVPSRRRWLTLLARLARPRRSPSGRAGGPRPKAGARRKNRRRRHLTLGINALFDLPRRLRPWRRGPRSRQTPRFLAPALRSAWRSVRRRERLERRRAWRLRRRRQRSATALRHPSRRRFRRRRKLSPRRRDRRRARLALGRRRRFRRRRALGRRLRALGRRLSLRRRPSGRLLPLALPATAGRRRRALRSLRRRHRPWRVAYRITSLRITDPETLEEHSQLLLEKGYRRSSYGQFYGDLLRCLRPAQRVVFLVLGHKSSRRLEQRVKFGADEPARERVVLGFLRDQVSRNPAYNYLRRNVEVKPWPKAKKVLREVPRRSRRLTTTFTVRFGEQLGQMLTQSGALRRSLDDYDRHSAEGFQRSLRHYRWLPVRGGLGAALRRGQGVVSPR